MNFHETINSSALGQVGYRDLQKIITQTNKESLDLSFPLITVAADCFYRSRLPLASQSAPRRPEWQGKRERRLAGLQTPNRFLLAGGRNPVVDNEF